MAAYTGTPLSRRARLFLLLVGSLSLVVGAGTGVFAATVANNGREVTAVRTVTADAMSSTTSETFVTVPGMSTTVRVPSGQKALLLITFSAVSACVNGSTYSCVVQALVDGTQVAAPGEVTFDQTAPLPGGDPYEAHSMQFVVGPLNAGTHTVAMQWRAGPHTFLVGDRTLTVLRSRVP